MIPSLGLGISRAPVSWMVCLFSHFPSKVHRGSYGFLSGMMAKEVFAQAGLPRDELMQIWSVDNTHPYETAVELWLTVSSASQEPR